MLCIYYLVSIYVPPYSNLHVYLRKLSIREYPFLQVQPLSSYTMTGMYVFNNLILFVKYNNINLK